MLKASNYQKTMHPTLAMWDDYLRVSLESDCIRLTKLPPPTHTHRILLLCTRFWKPHILDLWSPVSWWKAVQSNMFWAGGDRCYGEGRHVIKEDFRETWATPLWEALWVTNSAAWDLLAMWIYDPKVPLSCTEVFVSQRGKCTVLANAKYSYPVLHNAKDFEPKAKLKQFYIAKINDFLILLFFHSQNKN